MANDYPQPNAGASQFDHPSNNPIPATTPDQTVIKAFKQQRYLKKAFK